MSRSLCFFSSLKSHFQTYRHTHPKMKLVALSTLGAIAIAAAQQFVPLTVGSLILFLRNVFFCILSFPPEKKEVFPVDPASLSGTGASAATAQQQQQQQLLVQQQPETLVQQQQQLLIQQQPETLVEIPACTYEARHKKYFQIPQFKFHTSSQSVPVQRCQQTPDGLEPGQQCSLQRRLACTRSGRRRPPTIPRRKRRRRKRQRKCATKKSAPRHGFPPTIFVLFFALLIW